MSLQPLVTNNQLSSEEILLRTLIAQKLPEDFYLQATLTVARQLLGKILVVLPSDDSDATAGIIVETEGYVGQDDPACHAAVGRTRRNEIMWGESGRAYTYFTYGNHWMFNVVTESADYPAAVLVRAIQPIMGLAAMRDRRGLHLLKSKADERNLTNGPGKLCRAMGIDGTLNGQSLQGPHLYIATCPPELALPAFETVATSRIGISRGLELPWRFYVGGNRYVSK